MVRPSSTLLALSTFLATVIGVGVFGLPAMAARTGFVPLVAGFALLTPVLFVIHQRLAVLALGASERHRIPGYIGTYLGRVPQRIAVAVLALGLTGALLAYLLVGGEFLRLLLAPLVPVSSHAATLIYFLVGSALILRGARSVARTDLVLMAVFLIILFIFTGAATPVFRAAHLATTHWAALPAAYGVIFFSLWGVDVVPETVDLAGRNTRRSRAVFLIGLAGASLAYLLFAAVMLGVTGPVSADATLTRFLAATHPGLTLLVALFGFITTFTSFITLGMSLQRTLVLDLRLGPRFAGLAALLAPLLLYLAGVQDFLAIISVTGAVLLGIEGGLVLLAAEALQRQRSLRHGFPWVTCLLLMLLALGILYEASAFMQKTLG